MKVNTVSLLVLNVLCQQLSAVNSFNGDSNLAVSGRKS